jgi:cyclopropane fatty-acyl-phospholipid synthase-like methyltransferase
LLPADGEGRNAVYAAQQGWDTYAFDISEEAKHKAEQLAAAKQVTIHYETNDFQHYTAPAASFDCIALVFTHLPVEVKSVAFPKLVTYLKPGGHIILIGFTPAQLGKPSGGPKESSHLFTVDELLVYFKDMQSIMAETLDIELAEGEYHLGPASVVQLIATK